MLKLPTKLQKTCGSSGHSALGSLTATYFFFPKKHMPMLLHKWGDSGVAEAAILYFVKATS